MPEVACDLPVRVESCFGMQMGRLRLTGIHRNNQEAIGTRSAPVLQEAFCRVQPGPQKLSRMRLGCSDGIQENYRLEGYFHNGIEYPVPPCL